MNRITHRIRQPLLWCAVLIVGLISLLIPLINVITIQLLMIPILMLYMKLDVKQFCLAYVSSLFVLFLFMGGAGAVLAMYSLFFIPPVVVMGQLYKKGAAARTVLFVTSLMLIGEILLLLIMSYGTGLHPIESFKTLLNENISSIPDSLRQYIPNGYADTMTLMIPFLLVISVAYYVNLTHRLSRRLLKKSATPLPAFSPIRTWKLPKSIMWYFLIVIGMNFWVNVNSDLFFRMIVLNLLPLFVVIFIVQAIGLLYDFVYWKKWSRAVPVIAIALIILISPLLYLACLIGLLDVLLPLRKRFSDKL